MKIQFQLSSSGIHQFKLFQFGLIILFVIFTFPGCSASNYAFGAGTVVNEQNKPRPKVDKYTYKVIPAAENTFGYEISDQGKILVRQKTIPSLPGNNGFKTKNDAEKCAKLVILKLSRNIMPPTITPKEIDSLGIQSNPVLLHKNH
jgi:Domain of unknown function (DUF4907)